MAFVQDDIYTSSGSTVLFNSWTPYVSKFDTSTFYNWEQDNLPLYDLEERTYELWEQQGFPTSSVPGFSLTVSADTPTATLQQNTNIFVDLSSCIAAIPKVIRFPVLVEVCNFGDIGKLELNNFTFTENGSLEIINRNFSKIYNASADIQGINSVNGVSLASGVSSLDLSNTLANTSGVHISTPVLSSTIDERFGSNINTVLYPNHPLRKGHLVVGIGNSYGTVFTADPNHFDLPSYDAAGSDLSIELEDVSATDVWTGSRLLRNAQATGNNVGGCFYGNSLSHINVANCKGPIYIRNFFVDGDADATGGGTDNGIQVTNSQAVVENCSVVRCNNSGFQFENSEVTLSRAAFAYRIYSRKSATVRNDNTVYGRGFRFENSDVVVSAVQGGSTGAGGIDYQGSGSDVVICASRCRNGMDLLNSNLYGGYARITPADEGTGGILALELNSGGALISRSSRIPKGLESLIDIYGNSRGITAKNSTFNYYNLCVEDNQNTGLALINSNSEFIVQVGSGTLGDVSATNLTTVGQQFRKQVDFNGNGRHMVLENNSKNSLGLVSGSPLYFGQMSFSGVHGAIRKTGTASGIMPAIDVKGASQLELIHTKLIPRNSTHTNGSLAAYGIGIRATEDSTATLYGTGSGCTFVIGPAGYENQQFAAGLYADENSIINLHGPTFIGQFGVDVLAENGSVINICPPKKRNEYSYELNYFDLDDTLNHTSVELHSTRASLVANKNSEINLTDLGDYHQYWPSGGPTGEGQTILDSVAGDQDYPTGNNGVSSMVKFGSLQFFPNPQDATLVGAAGADTLTNIKSDLIDFDTFPIFIAKHYMNQYLESDSYLGGTAGSWFSTDTSGMTMGGVCIRAVDDSQVNVLNVHFPVGPVSSVMQSPYFDANGECERLFIWNIADTSRLNAAFCAVSGLYPGDAAYHGPSALWVSSSVYGENNTVYEPASGAPSGTPDTGILSVLDTFGAGSSVWVVPSGVGFNDPFGRSYPVSGPQPSYVLELLKQAGITGGQVTTPFLYGAGPHASNNQGVFRIYFSPKSETKILAADMSGYAYGATPAHFSGEVGIPYQVYAQGYNMSAPVSALGDVTSVSATYPNLLKLNGTNSIHTSGFYYCSEFLEDDPSQCMLDESASETFANAKNASTGSSGRPKRVTRYRSRGANDKGSEAFDGEGIVGFKSANIFDLKRDN